MLDLNLLHKAFASKGWQAVAFSACVCGLLAIMVIALGEKVTVFVEATVGSLIALFAVAAGVDRKKFNEMVKGK
jgi:hypothetical protein